MNRGRKSFFVLSMFLLAGLVVGGLLAEQATKIPFLTFFSYGENFGLLSPVVLDLGVIVLTIGLQLRFTIGGIIGMALAFFIYRRVNF